MICCYNDSCTHTCSPLGPASPIPPLWPRSPQIKRDIHLRYLLKLICLSTPKAQDINFKSCPRLKQSEVKCECEVKLSCFMTVNSFRLDRRQKVFLEGRGSYGTYRRPCNPLRAWDTINTSKALQKLFYLFIYCAYFYYIFS